MYIYISLVFVYIYIAYIVCIYSINIQRIYSVPLNWNTWVQSITRPNFSPKSPFVTLGSQFPGKDHPPPPVLN